jgi:nucleoside-diphosphate-sugar epimerase
VAVLVFGGSSQIGHFLLPRLLAEGHDVLAVSRAPRALPTGVQWVVGQLPAPLPSTWPPFSAVISYGPLLPFARWLAQVPLEGAPHVVATSSMSAQSKQDSQVPAERAVARTLLEGERALSEACVRRGLPLTILRPTLVYGAGLDRSLTPMARRAMRLRVFPLPAGRGLRQPVHADDLALATIAALRPGHAGARVLQIGGGERLTAAEMFARVRASLPVATVSVPLTGSLLRMGARWVPHLRGPLSRLERDLVADNGELTGQLGIVPRPFRPDAGCWTSVR